MSRLGSTLLSLALAGVITLAAYADPVLVGVAVVLVQVLVAVSPPLLTPAGTVVPSPRFVPAVLAGVVATVLTLEPDLLGGADGTSSDVLGASDTGMLSAILPAVAVALFAALIAQMLRKDGRQQLVQSVSYAVTLAVVAALAAGWIGTVQSLGDADAVAVAAAGLGAGLLAWMLPIDRWVCIGVSTVAGAGGGAAVAATVDSTMTVFFGVVVGAAAALFAILGQAVARVIARGNLQPAAQWGFPGALAVAFAAPAAYLGGQLLTVPSLR
ncbi:hypothetical protein [Aeromicrobium wangtongii]|uniref:Uncharacterized protein n=1 Tax=Aeromicrobium wangtongii TaxID=2969247 RepID=A0ABY5MB46_9ACTN|nr:hypothetical protein [Aeromicrobium wangtongii]MCD9196664.1 hypothetical protein [Aeromicrobium wangtongii]UUP14174.1 hypothetical protein NQV15_02350 [Aeromicrobium wangtongii]